MITAREAAYVACKASNWTLNYQKLFYILYFANVMFYGKNDRQLIQEPFEVGNNFLPRISNLDNLTNIYGNDRIENIELKDISIDDKKEEYDEIKDAVKGLLNKETYILVQFISCNYTGYMKAKNEGLIFIPLDYYKEEYSERHVKN